MKVVEEAMSLPLVSSAYIEVARVTSPNMESTITKVSPMVEMVSPMVDSVKTRVEEQLMTHIPTGISETVQSVQVKAVDKIAAIKKVNKCRIKFFAWRQIKLSLIILTCVSLCIITNPPRYILGTF
jgi:hypothetical protein